MVRRCRHTGRRSGTEVVQLYGRDLVASVARPVAQLLAYQRVTLAPGESARVEFRVPTGRLAFTDRALRRVVEPGEIELWVAEDAAAKSDAVVAEGIASTALTDGAAAAGAHVERVRLVLTGEVHVVGVEDARLATAVTTPLPRSTAATVRVAEDLTPAEPGAVPSSAGR